MISPASSQLPDSARPPLWQRLLPPPPLFLLQPVLARIVSRIAERFPELLERLGSHQETTYLIDPKDMPFVLSLKPDRANPEFRAHQRGRIPMHQARIAGKFLDLVRLVDCGADGDAMFFSRGLDISGNTEAVVTLRNAIDNVDGSIAGHVADLFGPPGRAALGLVRRHALDVKQ